MEKVKNEQDTMDHVDLPAGIKTATVLKYLGDLAGALAGIANDINQTIVNIVSTGSESNEEYTKENEIDD